MPNIDERDVSNTAGQWLDPGCRRDLESRIMGVGRGEHGPLELDADPRDFLSEACDELCDCCWYLAAEVERRRREGHETGRVALIGHFVGTCWGVLRAFASWGG